MARHCERCPRPGEEPADVVGVEGTAENVAAVDDAGEQLGLSLLQRHDLLFNAAKLSARTDIPPSTCRYRSTSALAPVQRPASPWLRPHHALRTHRRSEEHTPE